jgi:hypothetical protein
MLIVLQALKMGVSQCVNRIRTGEKIVPNDSDFLFEHKEQLLLPATLALPQGASVQWKDYCPFVFRCASCPAHAVAVAVAVDWFNCACRHLRQELGVDSGQYLSNICSGNMNVSSTAGRSGAVFMVPDGGRFLLKTLTKFECKTLRTCLKAYDRVGARILYARYTLHAPAFLRGQFSTSCCSAALYRAHAAAAGTTLT